jgi:hypothetical protein
VHEKSNSTLYAGKPDFRHIGEDGGPATVFYIGEKRAVLKRG